MWREQALKCLPCVVNGWFCRLLRRAAAQINGEIVPIKARQRR